MMQLLALILRAVTLMSMQLVASHLAVVTWLAMVRSTLPDAMEEASTSEFPVTRTPSTLLSWIPPSA
jgi:hypothetical protein